MKGINRSSQVAAAIRARLEQKGLSIRQFSTTIGFAYEHTRKVTAGLLPPSPRMLTSICKALDLVEREMQKVRVSDKLREKYGTTALEITGRDPELQPIEQRWPDLESEQRQILLDLSEMMAKRADERKWRNEAAVERAKKK